jgi:hypothetical protein
MWHSPAAPAPVRMPARLSPARRTAPHGRHVTPASAAEAVFHLAEGSAARKRAVAAAPGVAAALLRLMGDAGRPAARYWGLQVPRVKAGAAAEALWSPVQTCAC